MPQISNKDRRPHPPGEQRGGDSGRQQDGHLRAPQPAQSQDRVGTSFAARFGRVILGHGIAVVPTAMYHFQGKLDLSAQLMWFISNILSHKWDEDLPYPSLNKMARSGGVDKTQLYDYKDRLCKQGLLRVYPRQDTTGKRDTNAYDFAPLFGKLETLIASEAPVSNAIRGEGDSPEQFGAEKADSSFVARYGRVITSYGITAVPRAIFTHGAALGLSLQQVWFITYIFSYRWDTPLPYPSIKRMSARTGYSTVQLHNIKAELVRAGHLTLVPRYTAEGGQDSNAYDFSGLLDAITRLLEDPTPPPSIEDMEPPVPPADERSPRRGRKPASVRWSPTQHERPGGSELSRDSGAQLIGDSGDRLSWVGGGQFTGLGGEGLPGVSGVKLPPRSKVTPPSSVVSNSHRMVVEGLHEIEALKEEPLEQDDSNQRSQKTKLVARETKATITGYSPYIAAVASDYSRELGDLVHEASNIKQALNLWQNSGLSEQEFVDLMQEARRLTRKYQSRPTWDAMNNKMAYYFTCLRQLIGRSVSGEV